MCRETRDHLLSERPVRDGEGTEPPKNTLGFASYPVLPRALSLLPLLYFCYYVSSQVPLEMFYVKPDHALGE